MRIVSVPGRLVRDPVTSRVVDETGIDIDPADLNWSKLLADGDVRLGSEPKAEPEPVAPETAAELLPEAPVEPAPEEESKA